MDFTAPNRAAVIVGTVVGSLLLIFILLVFVTLLYWKLRSRYHHEKEVSNEIRYSSAEDTKVRRVDPTELHKKSTTSSKSSLNTKKPV